MGSWKTVVVCAVKNRNYRGNVAVLILVQLRVGQRGGRPWLDRAIGRRRSLWVVVYKVVSWADRKIRC